MPFPNLNFYTFDDQDNEVLLEDLSGNGAYQPYQEANFRGDAGKVRYARLRLRHEEPGEYGSEFVTFLNTNVSVDYDGSDGLPQTLASGDTFARQPGDQYGADIMDFQRDNTTYTYDDMEWHSGNSNVYLLVDSSVATSSTDIALVEVTETGTATEYTRGNLAWYNDNIETFSPFEDQDGNTRLAVGTSNGDLIISSAKSTDSYASIETTISTSTGSIFDLAISNNFGSSSTGIQDVRCFLTRDDVDNEAGGYDIAEAYELQSSTPLWQNSIGETMHSIDVTNDGRQVWAAGFTSNETYYGDHEEMHYIAGIDSSGSTFYNQKKEFEHGSSNSEVNVNPDQTAVEIDEDNQYVYINMFHRNNNIDLRTVAKIEMPQTDETVDEINTRVNYWEFYHGGPTSVNDRLTELNYHTISDDPEEVEGHPYLNSAGVLRPVEAERIVQFERGPDGVIRDYRNVDYGAVVKLEHGNEYLHVLRGDGTYEVVNTRYTEDTSGQAGNDLMQLKVANNVDVSDDFSTDLSAFTTSLSLGDLNQNAEIDIIVAMIIPANTPQDIYEDFRVNLVSQFEEEVFVSDLFF